MTLPTPSYRYRSAKRQRLLPVGAKTFSNYRGPQGKEPERG